MGSKPGSDLRLIMKQDICFLLNTTYTAAAGGRAPDVLLIPLCSFFLFFFIFICSFFSLFASLQLFPPLVHIFTYFKTKTVCILSMHKTSSTELQRCSKALAKPLTLIIYKTALVQHACSLKLTQS